MWKEGKGGKKGSGKKKEGKGERGKEGRKEGGHPRLLPGLTPRL